MITHSNQRPHSDQLRICFVALPFFEVQIQSKFSRNSVKMQPNLIHSLFSNATKQILSWPLCSRDIALKVHLNFTESHINLPHFFLYFDWRHALISITNRCACQALFHFLIKIFLGTILDKSHSQFSNIENIEIRIVLCV